jgi:hypothetical protein
MTKTVRVISGTYKNFKIKNQEFVLTGESETVKGKIQVKNNGSIPTESKKLTILADKFEILEGVPVSIRKSRAPANVSAFIPELAPESVEVESTETDEEAMDRIAGRFSVLDEMSAAAIDGNIRALIVSGPPGVGKSYGVETQLEKSSLFDVIAGNKVRFQIVKGAMTALGLYSQLYKFSDKKNVLVFDDCDSAFSDELALNILKAALDSGKRRRIFWNSDSRLLREEGIPNSFEFKGSVIFITNLNFGNVRSKKIADHLEALQSRCHYIDLTIDTERDKILRIKQVHRDADGGLFATYDFDGDEADQILQFMVDNTDRLREVSLRMCLKIADLVKISPQNWKKLAAATVCKR